MSEIRLLAMCGSARRDSHNRRLIHVLARGAEAAGARVTVIEPREFVLPLYDGDLEAEEGLPSAAAALQRLFAEHHGLLLATPEYNGFFPPLLKNTFDWISRPLADGSDRPGTVHLRGKPAGIAAASPGALGGIRALQHTRQYLANLGFLVVPAQVGVARAHEAFDATGDLHDAAQRAAVAGIGAAVAELAARLHT